MRHAGDTWDAEVAVDCCGERAGVSGEGEVSSSHGTNMELCLSYVLRETFSCLGLSHVYFEGLPQKAGVN